jgi:hypothetical protein
MAASNTVYQQEACTTLSSYFLIAGLLQQSTQLALTRNQRPLLHRRNVRPLPYFGRKLTA